MGEGGEKKLPAIVFSPLFSPLAFLFSLSVYVPDLQGAELARP